MACGGMKHLSEEKDIPMEKYCGNCLYHNVYEFPTTIFCNKRLVKGLNPKVSTLWNCEGWEPNMQECFCVREAKKILASKNSREKTINVEY